MAIGDITVGEKERGFIATGAETILSGGTTTSASHLTLNSQGADFTNRETGVASRVTGIADGMSPLDAVNRRQLDMTYGGIASVAALAALPSPAPNRHFSIGMGTSYYEGQTGVALGMKGSLTDTTQFSLGTSWNSSASTPLVNGGVSMSW